MKGISSPASKEGTDAQNLSIDPKNSGGQPTPDTAFDTTAASHEPGDDDAWTNIWPVPKIGDTVSMVNGTVIVHCNIVSFCGNEVIVQNKTGSLMHCKEWNLYSSEHDAIQSQVQHAANQSVVMLQIGAAWEKALESLAKARGEGA